jgi:hypothetical protein
VGFQANQYSSDDPPKRIFRLPVRAIVRLTRCGGDCSSPHTSGHQKTCPDVLSESQSSLMIRARISDNRQQNLLSVPSAYTPGRVVGKSKPDVHRNTSPASRRKTVTGVLSKQMLWHVVQTYASEVHKVNRPTYRRNVNLGNSSDKLPGCFVATPGPIGSLKSRQTG